MSASSVRDLVAPVLACLPDEGEELPVELLAAVVSALDAVFELFVLAQRRAGW